MPNAEVAYGQEALILDNTTVKKLANLPRNADGSLIPCVAHIQCAKQVDSNTKGNVAVRFTNDGVTAPTATLVGFEINPGDIPFVTCSNLDQMQFIGVANNARINVWYSPYPQALNMYPTR